MDELTDDSDLMMGTPQGMTSGGKTGADVVKPAETPLLSADEQFMLKWIGVDGAHLGKRSAISNSLENKGLIKITPALLTYAAELTDAGKAALEGIR